jgi:hypothetical protein
MSAKSLIKEAEAEERKGQQGQRDRQDRLEK